MPLINSKTKEAFNKNVKAEIEVGKSPEQAAAIAYAIKRKANDANSNNVNKTLLIILNNLLSLSIKLKSLENGIKKKSRP